MSKAKKILSLFMCCVLALHTVAYADTVIIGAAPSSTDKSVTNNAANTTFLQNQYTGPGLLPSSSNNLGTSPLMNSVMYDNSVGQMAATVDENGVADKGPKSQTISSPASNNAYLAQNTGTSAVITNSAADKGTPASNTSDSGPTTVTITAPKAGGEYGNVAAGVYVNGQYVQGNGPLGGTSNNSTNAPTSSQGGDTNYPSYTTQTTTGQVAGTNVSLDIIKYDAVDIAASKPAIKAPGALVVNASTKQIYFSKGGFTAFAPAALANIVTAYILLSYRGLDDNLAVSQAAVSNLESGATTAGLKAGDTIKVRDAIGALFVKSCCDVANVVAENVGGSIPNFVLLMNQTVKNWGCVGTNFTNPTGLNNDAQVTNTYDAAIIMDKATQDATLKTFLALSSYQLPATSTRRALTLYSRNSIITPGTNDYYKGISASRMGYTSKAKYTIASMLDYNGNRLIAVVLKANGSQFSDTTKLLNYAKVACVEAANKGIGSTTTSAATAMGAITNTQTIASQASQALSAGDTQGQWMQDETGWYFQKSDGTKANNEWIKQNGKMFCVDSTGYMVIGWREFSNGKMYYFDPSNGEFRYNTWVNVSTGAYYLQADGSLAKAESGKTTNITTSVGTYTIDDTGKAIAKIS